LKIEICGYIYALHVVKVKPNDIKSNFQTPLFLALRLKLPVLWIFDKRFQAVIWCR